MSDRQRLIHLISQLAVRRGEFKLASGRMATYYLDCRQVTLHGEGANLISRLVVQALTDRWPQAIGGMTIGADPITAAAVTIAWQMGRPLSGFMVRKEAKSHGTARQIEGPVSPGQTAVLVEDTLTTGGSVVAAAQAVRQFGMSVDRVVAVVDRLEGGRENLAQQGLDLISLITVRDLGL